MEDFLKDLPDKQSKKIAWTLRVVRDLEQVPTQYLKKLKSTDDIWEVPATIGNNTFRLLGFFDGPKLIVLTSGFAKKSNKVPKTRYEVPRSAIETAEERKRDYFTSWESLRSEPEERTMKKDDLEILIDQKKAESPEFAENFEEGQLNFKIGVILRQAREQMGATQADVAEKLNTTKSVISRMENHAEDIKLSTLTKYAKALGKKVKIEIQ